MKMIKNSNIKQLLLSFLVLTFLFACKKDSDSGIVSSDNPDSEIPGIDPEASFGLNAKGEIPAQLENKLYLGLFEHEHFDWIVNSGIPWNTMYLYLVPGWANNWGLEEYNGDFATRFMAECDEIDALPVFEFYVFNDIGGSTDDLLGKTANASLMKQYFEEYILLLNRVKEYGKPVIILIEADGFAVLQIQSQNIPNTYSAVAASNVPELANLPNTVAGWGLAFLELKKKLNVDNVSLGMHISAWATKEDITYNSSEIPLQPEVDITYNFLASLGLAANQTGLEYDFLVGDPSDRDADFYRVKHGMYKWWDTSSVAGINTQSFNRYAEWLRLWNIKAEKRWILWQIPLGNNNHLNVPNTGKPREGYKDNRVEYFLGENSVANIAKFADCGVVALLFGRGESEQANYTNDQDENGNLYMKARAKNFYNNGGMTLKR
jgi:hypothetical protein